MGKNFPHLKRKYFNKDFSADYPVYPTLPRKSDVMKNRYLALLSAALVTLYMSTFMTFAITGLNTAFDASLLHRWWKSLYIA